MLGKLFARTSKEKIVAIADVGSGSVAFMIARVPSHGPTVVLAAERAALPIEERTPRAAVTGLSSELMRIGQKVLGTYNAKKDAPKPQQIICLIRAPWTRSVATSGYTRFDKDGVVTAETLKTLAREALSHAGGSGNVDFLEAGVAGIELNGYPTRNPEGKRAHEIRVTALVSECDKEVRAAVERALEGILPHVPRTLRSGARALVSVLKEYSSAQDYVVVGMGGEATTVLSVREGTLTEQCLVYEGTNSILRRISKGGLPEETLGLIRMIARDQCTSPACEAVETALASAEPELVKKFGESLAKCSARHRLPNTLFLLAPEDMVPWLEKFLARIDFTQFTSTAQPFSVRSLSLKDMSEWAVSVPRVNLDSGLATAAAFVNIEERS